MRSCRGALAVLAVTIGLASWSSYVGTAGTTVHAPPYGEPSAKTTIPSSMDSPRGSSSGAASVGHVAVAVTQLDKAVSWYRTILGFELIDTPILIQTDTSPLGGIARALFGQNTKSLRIAQMKAGNNVGIELFEFVEPRTSPGATVVQRRAGFLHLAIVQSNIESLVRKIEENGGKVIVRGVPSRTRTVVFCQDPDGTVIEIATRGWD